MEVIPEVTEVTTGTYANEDYEHALAEWAHLGEGPSREGGSSINFPLLKTVTAEECWKGLCSRDLAAEKRKAMLTVVSSSSCGPFSCCGSSVIKNYLTDEKLTVLALTKVPLNNSDLLHLQILKSVFVNLAPGQNCRRFGSHWELIGFQGDDPATDLRGMGIFGLFQLLYITSDATIQDRIRLIFELSQDTVQQFPFCVVGLNLSKMVVAQLRLGNLNRICNKHKGVIDVVNKLYCAAFVKFYKIWRRNHKTIADAGFVMQEVEKYIDQRTVAALKGVPKKQNISTPFQPSEQAMTKKKDSDVVQNFHSVV